MARVPPPRPGTRPQPTPRELLVRTWPGRIFLAAAAIKLVVIVWRLEAPLPGTVRATSGLATLGLVAALLMNLIAGDTPTTTVRLLKSRLT